MDIYTKLYLPLKFITYYEVIKYEYININILFPHFVERISGAMKIWKI